MNLSPHRTGTWFSITLVLKIGLFLLFLYLGKSWETGEINEWGVTISKDYGELLGPADNYFEHGTYSLEKGSNIPYAGRLPGYSMPYMLFRALFPQAFAVFLLILAQIVLSAFAAVKTAQWIYEFRSQKWMFFVALTGISVFIYAVPWEGWTYPESFALSAWLLGLYYFQTALKSASAKLFLLSGFFVAWAFFLRGFLGVYFLSFALLFGAMWFWHKEHRRQLFKFALLFIIPLLTMETVWTIRNKVSIGEWIFLQTSFGYSDTEQEYALDNIYKPSILELRKLIASWGGDNVHFYPGSDMEYFYMKNDPGSFFPFKQDIFSDQFSKDSLIYVRELVQASFNSDLPLKTRVAADKKLSEKAQKFSQEFKENKPLYFYVKAPLFRLKNLVVRNVTGNWPGPAFSASPIWYKVYKLASLGLYYLSIASGLFFILYLFFKKLNHSGFHILWSSSIFLAFAFMFLINTAEFKYFMTGAVNLFLISLLGLSEFLSLRSRKSTRTS